jgi:hypothetical protein
LEDMVKMLDGLTKDGGYHTERFPPEASAQTETFLKVRGSNYGWWSFKYQLAFKSDDLDQIEKPLRDIAVTLAGKVIKEINYLMGRRIVEKSSPGVAE